MRPDRLLLLVVLAATLTWAGEQPVIGRVTPPKGRALKVEWTDGGVRHVEQWERQGKRTVLSWVDEWRGPRIIEGRDTNGDNLVDEEKVTTRDADGGVVSMVETSWPLDGGDASRRHVSTALGGNKRRVDEELWRDGGWVTVESYDSSWHDEHHHSP